MIIRRPAATARSTCSKPCVSTRPARLEDADLAQMRVFGRDPAEIVPHASYDRRAISASESSGKARREIAPGAFGNAEARADDARQRSADRRRPVERQQSEQGEKERRPPGLQTMRKIEARHPHPPSPSGLAASPAVRERGFVSEIAQSIPLPQGGSRVRVRLGTGEHRQDRRISSSSAALSRHGFRPRAPRSRAALRRQSARCPLRS